MTFRSSRGGGGEAGFREAVLTGLAPDGGLFLPARIPRLPEGWREARSLSELGRLVLAEWIDEPMGEELARIVADALDFPLPLRRLSRGRYVLELFHGPTLSFKDFGARTMARLVDHYLSADRRRITILTATSGDTGSAVADGFAGLDNVRVMLLYPRGLISEVQERQLLADRPGVVALAVDGTFDDCQRLVKQAFGDAALAHAGLSSANSINIGRLLPQQLYYLWGRLLLERLDPGPDPVFVVPSGNLGNLTAGMLAAEAGMHVRGFVAAHNANDYFPRFVAGEVAAFDYPKTRSTISNAMDVGAPSNFERLHALFGETLNDRVWSTSVTDEATRSRIARTLADDAYLACPHTAVGLEGLDRYRQESGDESPAIVLATAHPAKFPRTIEQVTGNAPREERLEALVSQTRPVVATSGDYDEFRRLVDEFAMS